MKAANLLIFLLLTVFSAFSQQHPAQEAISSQPYTLNQRFQIMKSKSQTWEDYKVIKEFVLDGVIKIANDSVRASKVLLAKANEDIARLRNEVKEAQEALMQKEKSMEEIVYASDHIGFAGISFEKSVFVVLVVAVVVGLLVLVGIVSGRLRLMYFSVKERMESVSTLTNEFEEYKRKALERQTKLSRELQTERNKLMELKRG